MASYCQFLAYQTSEFPVGLEQLPRSSFAGSCLAGKSKRAGTARLPAEAYTIFTLRFHRSFIHPVSAWRDIPSEWNDVYLHVSWNRRDMS